MSLWADYVKERLGWETIEVEGGFVSFVAEPEFEITEIYVVPDKRGGPLVRWLGNAACSRARELGKVRVWAKVVPGLPFSEQALKTNLHYGFRLVGVRDGNIILVKDLGV